MYHIHQLYSFFVPELRPRYQLFDRKSSTRVLTLVIPGVYSKPSIQGLNICCFHRLSLLLTLIGSQTFSSEKKMYPPPMNSNGKDHTGVQPIKYSKVCWRRELSSWFLCNLQNNTGHPRPQDWRFSSEYGLRVCVRQLADWTGHLRGGLNPFVLHACCSRSTVPVLCFFLHHSV